MDAEEVQCGGEHQQRGGDLDAHAQVHAGLRGLTERSEPGAEQGVGGELGAEEPGDRRRVAGQRPGLVAGQRPLAGDRDGQQPALDGEARQAAGGQPDQ